ncbi:MAG: hypothetical protein V1494_00085 [Candidatus Diapherotrites archaeon]
MAGTLEALGEIFGNLLKAKMWLVAIASFAVSIGMIIVAVVVAILAAIFAVLFASMGASGIVLLLLMLFALGIIGLAAVLIVAGIINGMYVKAAEGLFNKKDYKLEEMFNAAKAKWKRLALIILVEGIIVGLIALITLAPAIISFASAFGALINDPGALLQLTAMSGETDPSASISFFMAFFGESLSLLFIGIALMSLVNFLISPFLVLFLPLVMLENNGVIASIQRAFDLGAKNYLPNLLILLPVAIFSLAIGAISFLVSFFSGIGFIASMVFSFITEIVSFSAATKIYLLNSKTMGK